MNRWQSVVKGKWLLCQKNAPTALIVGEQRNF